MRYIAELSGECPELALAELLTFLNDHNIEAACISNHGPISIIDSSDLSSIPLDRLGLTKAMFLHLGTSEPVLTDVISSIDVSKVPKGSIGVRARRVEGKGKGVGSLEINKGIGAFMQGSEREIDIHAPDNLIVPLIHEQVHTGLCIFTNTEDWEARKVQNRPFFSPVSLHPKYARALINLSGSSPGVKLVDPMCGTGGILLEAGLLGAVSIGGDISSEMVEGTRSTLDHYGIDGYILSQGDLEDTLKEHSPLNSIATDPPYGRASTTNKEDIKELYKRLFLASSMALVPGGRLALVVPDLGLLPNDLAQLDQMISIKTTVHGSLDRHYCVFQKASH